MNFQQIVAIFFVTCCLLFTVNFAHAAPQTIEATGVYVMDTERDETFAVAQDRARKEALRAAVEQSGLYLQGVSKSVNNKLTKDELQVLAAAILKVQSENVSKKVDGKNIEFTVSITALVDADSVNLDELVAKKKSWERRVEENQRQQKEYEQLKAENERLKVDYAKATNDSERKKIRDATTANNKLFQANQYLDKSLDMLNAGEWLSSLDESKKALETDPTNADALASRARAHVKANQLEVAKDEITQAIALNPNNNEYKVILGNVYFAAGEYDNALDTYNQVLTVDANNVEAYFQRGMIYFDRDKDYDKAIAEFDIAVAKNPDYAEVYYKRGMAYFNKNLNNSDMLNRNAPPNNLIGAFDNFSKYLTFDNAPNKADATQLRKNVAGMLYERYRMTGETELAEKYFSFFNDGGDAATHIKRGKDYLNPDMSVTNESPADKVKRLDNAIAEFTKAIELEPDNADAYGGRAEAYIDKGWNNQEFLPYAKERPFFDLASKDANKCLELNPNHQGAKIVLERIKSVNSSSEDPNLAKDPGQFVRDKLAELKRQTQENVDEVNRRREEVNRKIEESNRRHEEKMRQILGR
ncbi:MAG: tetratricopeptide repeat protein [Selenomonadaceae bacterium]|nr:tetratricopeptide repeat protein [Selenomonadaceae bacterium]